MQHVEHSSRGVLVTLHMSETPAETASPEVGEDAAAAVGDVAQGISQASAAARSSLMRAANASA